MTRGARTGESGHRLKQTTLKECWHPVGRAEPPDAQAAEKRDMHVYIQENLGELLRSEWENGKCECRIECNQACRNRRCRIECDAETCNLDSCSNRPWSKHNTSKPALDIRISPQQGLGAFASESIQKGYIVREYVGEIINEREKEARFPRNDCKYIMGYGTKWYIDAEYYGNAARFFNHSCVPTCSAEEGTVSGVYRVGIVALKDIQAGEEITFNYGSNYRISPCMCFQCRSRSKKKRKRSQSSIEVHRK